MKQRIHTKPRRKNRAEKQTKKHKDKHRLKRGVINSKYTMETPGQGKRQELDSTSYQRGGATVKITTNSNGITDTR